MAILGEILVSSIVLLFFSCVSAGHGHHGGGHSNIFRKQVRIYHLFKGIEHSETKLSWKSDNSEF